MTLKLEVGKKYVDSVGGVVEIIASHKHDDGKIKFWAYSKRSYRNYRGNGVNMGNDMDYDLVKEHVEPRTKDIWVVWIDNGRLESLTVKNKGEIYDEEGNMYPDIISTKKVTMVEGEMDG